MSTDTPSKRACLRSCTPLKESGQTTPGKFRMNLSALLNGVPTPDRSAGSSKASPKSSASSPRTSAKGTPERTSSTSSPAKNGSAKSSPATTKKRGRPKKVQQDRQEMVLVDTPSKRPLRSNTPGIKELVSITPSRRSTRSSQISPKSTSSASSSRTPAKKTPAKKTPAKKTPAKIRTSSRSAKNSERFSPGKTPTRKRPTKANGSVQSTPVQSTAKRGRKKKEEDIPIELNIYQKYKHALSTTIKTELVFREKETNEIRSFLSDHIKGTKSTSIYISGPPGTGKTASVTAILDELEKELKFKRLFFNGMAFTTAANFFKKVLLDLTGEAPSTKDLTPLIVEALSKRNAVPYLLVLDEIDILDSRHQEILYTIFNLPMYKSARVIVIGIANTLDFTSTKLIRYHTLNITPVKEVTFQPYDATKLTGILKDRIRELENEPLFQPMAVEFCAKKVASHSGDARKALEILRRSVELVEQEGFQSSRSSNLLKEQNNQEVCKQAEIRKVSIQHVMKIVNQVYSDKFVEASEDDYNFPIQQKIVLCVILLMARDGNRNPELGKCYDRLIQINKEKALKLEISTANNFMDMCETLEGKSFISVQRSKDLRCAKLSLSISEEQAKELLKTDYVTKSILFA